MSIKIRLARGGAKKRPFYRIVIADSRSPRDGRFIERIGSYNPMVAQDHPDRLKLDLERAKHWLMAERPRPEQTKKSQPRAKAQERAKAAQAAGGEGAPAEAAS